MSFYPQLVSGIVGKTEKSGCASEARQAEPKQGGCYTPPPEPAPVKPPCPPQPRKPCPRAWVGKLVMSPPLYADMGKHARDVFGKGYHFGLLKLNVKTKTDTGVEFSTGGESNLESGKVSGNLETKYKFKEYGVTFTERWNTNNVLGTELSLSDFCDGAKLGVDTSFTPQTGEHTLKLKAQFLNESVALNLDSDFKKGGPVIKGAAVLGYAGWLCGYQTSFDTSQSKLTENKFAMGFVAKDFILNTTINDGKSFTGSVYHKVNKKLETGIQLSWKSSENEAELGIGCKYNLDPDAALRLKVDNNSMIGIGYSQALRDGVTLFLSAQLNGKNFNEGGHKVGLCLELEA